MSETVVSVQDVQVAYPMDLNQADTLKETVINLLKGRSNKIIKLSLDSVNFRAEKGEFVALVGHNGSGKSTLLKTIAGIIVPEIGKVHVHGKVAPLIELGAGFDPEMTGLENVYLSCSLMGLTKKEIDDRLAEIEAFADIGDFFNQPVKKYSSGMYMRLGFACAISIEAEILLIDEILAVGDENFQRKCMTKMLEVRKSGTTVILVSHDLNAIRKLADRVVVLDEGKILMEGLADQALNFYLNLMQSKAFQKKNDAQALAIRDSGVADRPAGRILNAKFHSDETDKILIDFEINKHIDKPPTVGFAIVTANDTRVMGGNNQIFDIRKDDFTEPGQYQMLFEFDKLPLATGRYKLVAALHNHDLTETIDLNHQSFYFYVVAAQDERNLDQNIILPEKLLKTNASSYLI